MAYGGYSYIDLKYAPQKDDFVTVLWVKGDCGLEKLAEGLAAESSVGTWTELTTMNDFVWKKLRAKVFKMIKFSENSGYVYIAYPFDHFDSKNLLQILASIRGNIYGMKEIKELKFMDWTMPEKFQRQFPGPSIGVKEIRKMVGTKTRPHVGTIVKPKVGLNPSEWSKVAGEAFLGGLDMVKDDENLVDQDFCRWQDRVVKTIDAAEKARDETGDGKIYVSNITDFVPRMMERIDFLAEHGWKMCMIDVYMMGIAGLQQVLEELHKRDFLVHAHRAGHGAETRGNTGASFTFWEKIYRLLGVSQLHTGTGVGKMEGSPFFVRKYGEIAKEEKVKGAEPMFLNFRWSRKIKPMMPVASGGLHPGQVEGVCAIYGKDVTIMAGGGIHGHPGGTLHGAMAHRAASEAVDKGIPLIRSQNADLKTAIEKWGYVSAGEIKNELRQAEKTDFRKLTPAEAEG
jgi:ribulose-bisphosphate carboxylase large chain